MSYLNNDKRYYFELYKIDILYSTQKRGGTNDKINHLSKQFNNVNVLENINLNIEDGICTALIGKNGAGKSTLIDIIIGNKAIDFGEIIDENSLINRKHMAVLYQKHIFQN